MPPAFDETMRALRGDRSRWGLAIAAVLLAAGWVVWMTIARVSVYRTSERARIEVLPAPTRIAPLSSGRVIAVQLKVGARVAVGDVLLELDSSTERVALERAKGQLTALEPELALLEREVAAEQNAVAAGESSARSSAREQVARQRGADADLAHAENELVRVEQLVAEGASARADLDRAKADVAIKRAEHDAREHAAAELVAGERERDAGRRLRIAELERQRADVAATIAAARADVSRLELELDHRVVRAPIAGVLGSISTLQPGAVVAAGDAIATIVPAGTLQIIADYGPAAIGRLAPGQRGRLRLDGFPWTRWGTIPLHVTTAANEVRDGVIRVELAIDPGEHRMPLAHGMTGQVDVEVEDVTPGELVLRSISDRSSDTQ